LDLGPEDEAALTAAIAEANRAEVVVNGCIISLQFRSPSLLLRLATPKVQAAAARRLLSIPA